jgi:hypothetical protein
MHDLEDGSVVRGTCLAGLEVLLLLTEWWKDV